MENMIFPCLASSYLQFFRISAKKVCDVVKWEGQHCTSTLQKSAGLDKEPGSREADLESSTAVLTALKRLCPPPV